MMLPGRLPTKRVLPGGFASILKLREVGLGKGFEPSKKGLAGLVGLVLLFEFALYWEGKIDMVSPDGDLGLGEKGRG